MRRVHKTTFRDNGTSKYFFAISPETGQPMLKDGQGRILIFRVSEKCAKAAFELYGDRVAVLVGGMSPERFEEFKSREQYAMAGE